MNKWSQGPTSNDNENVIPDYMNDISKKKSKKSKENKAASSQGSQKEGSTEGNESKGQSQAIIDIELLVKPAAPVPLQPNPSKTTVSQHIKNFLHRRFSELKRDVQRKEQQGEVPIQLKPEYLRFMHDNKINKVDFNEQIKRDN